MDYLPGKFIWFEHLSNDSAKARAFYEPLFNWHVERMPMGDQNYSMILNGSTGIGGLRPEDGGKPSRWISYLSVIDVDASFQTATAAGAKALQSPTDYDPVGRGATIADPTGAELCLWTSRDGDPPDVDQAPVGSWYWNELWTPDVKRALAFYESVFGYSRDSMDMGEQGTYYLLKKGEKTTVHVEYTADYIRPDPSLGAAFSDPDFPLERELATMQAQDALISGGGRAAEVPGPGPGPALGAPGAAGGAGIAR